MKNDANNEELDILISEYQRFTQDVMPALSKTKFTHWTVSEDHCFQRIILDNAVQDCWYNKIGRPAHLHLDLNQAKHAVYLCYSVVSGMIDLNALNSKSLNWRRKQLQFSFDEKCPDTFRISKNT